MAFPPELASDILAQQPGLTLPSAAGPNLSVPSDLTGMYRFNLSNSVVSPLVSQGSTPMTEQPVPTSPTGSKLGDFGLALAMAGAGLQGDVLPTIAVLQQMEQRKQQAALLRQKQEERARQEAEQQRQHGLGMVERIMSANIPSGAKLEALDKLRADVPWAGTIADGLKDAHIQNFNVLRQYIPQEAIDKLSRGTMSPAEVAAWGDYGLESAKLDAKERVRDQAYDIASNLTPDKRTPSQQKLVEEREADLALKQAETDLKRSQAGQAPKLSDREKELLKAGDEQLQAQAFQYSTAKYGVPKFFGELTADEQTEVLKRWETTKAHLAAAQGAAGEMAKPIETSSQEKIGVLQNNIRILNELQTTWGELTPEQKSRYVGVINFPLERLNQFVKQQTGAGGDKDFARFAAKVYMAKNLAFQSGGKQLTPFEASVVFGYTPTGEEMSVSDFEAKMIQAGENTRHILKLTTEMATTPRGEIKGKLLEGFSAPKPAEPAKPSKTEINKKFKELNRIMQ